MRDRYITATLELLAAGHDPEAVVRGLKATLDRRDHGKLYARVLRGVLRALTDTQRTTTARVVVANAAASEKLSAVIAEHLQALKADTHTVTIDPTLIGGVVVEHGSKRIDASYKRALIDLYTRITA